MSWLMYDFHNKLDNKKFDANLFSPDTDSLTYKF